MVLSIIVSERLMQKRKFSEDININFKTQEKN